MKRFSEVNSDLLRGGAPTAEDLRILHNVWGVQRIVSLDKSVGLSIAPTCKELGLEQIIIPIGNDQDLESVLDYLKANVVTLLSGKKPTYVHCLHGRDRTGLAVALYRIQADGWTPAEAYKEALSFGFGDGLTKERLEIFKNYLFDGSNESHEKVKNQPDISELARQTSESNPTNADSYFSPINPGDMQPANDRRKRRRKLRQLVEEDLNESMAQVGLNSGVSPILRNTDRDSHNPHPILPYGYSYIL